MIFGASSSHPVGETGGEESHVLTVNEIPSHSHVEQIPTTVGNRPLGTALDGKNPGGTTKCLKTAPENCSNDGSPRITTESTGGTKPHNNMPPYECFFIWERLT